MASRCAASETMPVAMTMPKHAGDSSARPVSTRPARITRGEHFPLVTVRLVPVHDAPAVLRVDARVHRPVHAAAVCNARRLDAPEDGVEAGLVDAEAVVDQRDGFGPLVEVEGQPVVHVYRSERADARFGPGNA